MPCMLDGRISIIGGGVYVTIPVIHCRGDNLPIVWENAMKQVWENGYRIKTDYDRKTDPYSRDAMVVCEVENPFNEPRYHRAIPMGLDDLYMYIKEVTEGVHDHWIAPDDGKWSYTYHQRIRKYPNDNGNTYDQIEYILKTLEKSPFSRRAQAITYIPGEDHKYEDPPCLQRIWCRIAEGKLQMHVHMRSNDLYKAAFSNMIASMREQTPDLNSVDTWSDSGRLNR